MNVGTLTTEVRAASGVVLQRRTQPIHSWTRNFIRAWGAMMIGESHSVTLHTGTSATISESYAYTTTTSTRGIVVGTSDAPSIWGDTALAARIAGGSSAGQLIHNTQNEDDTLLDGVRTMTIERVFTNASGGEIIVREVGLHAGSASSSTSTLNLHMILRDVLDSAISIPDGDELYVKLEFSGNEGADNILNRNGTAGMRRMLQSGNVPIILRNGSSSTNSAYYPPYSLTGNVGSENGIRAGASDQPFDKDASNQQWMDDEIVHGSESGQLLHGNCTADSIVEDVDGGFIRLRRSFVNDSGATITIKEMALCVGPFLVSNYVMLARKVLDVPIVLADQEAAEILVDFTVEH